MVILITHKKEIREVYKGEDIYWRQRARCKWLNEGDANTTFFYEVTNNRRRINTIHSSRDGKVVVQGENELKEMYISTTKEFLGAKWEQGSR